MIEIMFYIIFIPLSHVNGTNSGCQIWHFDTSNMAPPQKFRGNTVYIK